MNLKEQLAEDMKAAMRSGDTLRRDTVRMARNAIEYAEKAKGQPLNHSEELVALQQAARLRGDWRFNDCSLLVTLEPCPMCAGALVQARMGRVVFGAPDPKRGALGGCLDLASDPSAHHHMQVIGGLHGEACSRQLEGWFRRRRQRGRGRWSEKQGALPPAD